MSYLLTVLLLTILAACVGSLYTEGIWSNAIRFINVVTAGLLAMNFFEPVARGIENYAPSFTFVADFAALWGVFAVFVIVLGELTNRVSQVKVRFLSIADQIGGAVLAVMIGWVMVSFTLTTLHTAPLSRNFLFGGFRAESRMFMGLAPDRNWLGFVKMVSRGSFCQSPVAEFDPKNDFMPKYTSRRESVSELVQSRDTIFGEPDSPQRGGDRGR